MPRIKLTKTELKTQTDALRRFRHFLPMLQLKKQQLQAEIAHIDARIAQVRKRERGIRADLAPWVGLFAIPEPLLDGLVDIEAVETESGNIAGVAVPIFKGVRLARRTLDPFDSPPWLDDAQDVLEALLSCRAETGVLEDERRRVAEELRVTSQRVNLFEKVKIPECRENIRVIRIALGDEQTAAVARGKIAKQRAEARRRHARENAA